MSDADVYTHWPLQVFSLLGDFFSVHQRAFVAALVQIAMGAGMSLGQLIAGVVGEDPDLRKSWLPCSRFEDPWQSWRTLLRALAYC